MARWYRIYYNYQIHTPNSSGWGYLDFNSVTSELTAETLDYVLDGVINRVHTDYHNKKLINIDGLSDKEQQERWPVYVQIVSCIPLNYNDLAQDS